MSLYSAVKRALKDVLSSILDIPVSTRASESTLQAVRDKLDLTLSALRDALRGTEGKTMTDLDSQLSNVLNQLDITISDLRDALKPTRTLPTQELSNQSIAAGEAAEFPVNNTQTDGYSALVVTVKAAYNASASKGVRVRWLYSPDGTNFDTVEDAEAAGNYEDLSFAAGETRIKTVLIPLFQPYVKVQIVNQDTGYAVTVDAWRVLMR